LYKTFAQISKGIEKKKQRDGSFASLGKRLSSLSEWQKRSLFLFSKANEKVSILLKDIKSTPFRGGNDFQYGLFY
jgi:hypothetical protein